MWWANRENILYAICVLQPHRTVKIQVGDLDSGSMDFQLNLNSRASDLLAQFYRQFLRSPENGKGKMRRYDILFWSHLATVYCMNLASYKCDYLCSSAKTEPDTRCCVCLSQQERLCGIFRLRPVRSRREYRWVKVFSNRSSNDICMSFCSLSWWVYQGLI